MDEWMDEQRLRIWRWILGKYFTVTLCCFFFMFLFYFVFKPNKQSIDPVQWLYGLPQNLASSLCSSPDCLVAHFPRWKMLFVAPSVSVSVWESVCEETTCRCQTRPTAAPVVAGEVNWQHLAVWEAKCSSIPPSSFLLPPSLQHTPPCYPWHG